MSKIDDCSARHKEVWVSVARYSVYCNDRGQGTSAAGTTTVLQCGMTYPDALAFAELSGIPFREQSSWTKPLFGLLLENQDVASAAVRSADIWSGLTAAVAPIATA